MRQLLLAALTSLFTATAAPAFAASIFDFSFSGVVTSAIESSDSGPSKSDPFMIGEPYSAFVQIQQTGASTTGTASLNVNVRGEFFLFGPPLAPNQSSSGATYSGNALCSSSASGYAGSLPGFTFTHVNGNPSSDTLTAQFLVAGINRADDTGTLDLTLRSTPLPPTLPLFAFALLMLGIVAYVRRDHLRTESQSHISLHPASPRSASLRTKPAARSARA
jgi:hypothetical protein